MELIINGSQRTSTSHTNHNGARDRRTEKHKSNYECFLNEKISNRAFSAIADQGGTKRPSQKVHRPHSENSKNLVLWSELQKPPPIYHKRDNQRARKESGMMRISSPGPVQGHHLRPEKSPIDGDYSSISHSKHHERCGDIDKLYDTQYRLPNDHPEFLMRGFRPEPGGKVVTNTAPSCKSSESRRLQ